jgi:hypothetical protein
MQPKDKESTPSNPVETEKSQPKNIPNIHERGRPPQITEIAHQSFSLLVEALERSRRGAAKRY